MENALDIVKKNIFKGIIALILLKKFTINLFNL